MKKNCNTAKCEERLLPKKDKEKKCSYNESREGGTRFWFQEGGGVGMCRVTGNASSDRFLCSFFPSLQHKWQYNSLLNINRPGSKHRRFTSPIQVFLYVGDQTTLIQKSHFVDIESNIRTSPSHYEKKTKHDHFFNPMSPTATQAWLNIVCLSYILLGCTIGFYLFCIRWYQPLACVIKERCL